MVTCEAGNETTFTLHDGQQLVFENLPAGTRYCCKRKRCCRRWIYTDYTVVENGVTTVNGTQGNETDDVSSAKDGNSNLVGENDNKVTFVNTYNDTPITGIIVNNLSFIALIGIAVAAFGSLAIIKRKRVSKR